MTRAPPILFYSRCKPWEVDCTQVAIDHLRVFFGYVIKKDGAVYEPAKPESWILPPNCDEVLFSDHRKGKGTDPETKWRRDHTANRNLIASVGEGSIVMIPRPSEGFIYCGEVRGEFRLAYKEECHRDTLEAFKNDDAMTAWRKAAGVTLLKHDEHYRIAGEVAQGWDVAGPFVAVPVPMVPATIRRSLFGRSTFGKIHASKNPEASPAERDPCAEMLRLMQRVQNGQGFPPLPYTLDIGHVRNRLKDAVTPSLFEALVVAILQLEQGHLRWFGVGGSGDGGVDGIAAGESGSVVALLQCKWHHDGTEVFGGVGFDKARRAGTKLYFAYMLGLPTPETDVELLDLEWLVGRIVHHHRELPFAKTIRVGAGR